MEKFFRKLPNFTPILQLSLSFGLQNSNFAHFLSSSGFKPSSVSRLTSPRSSSRLLLVEPKIKMHKHAFCQKCIFYFLFQTTSHPLQRLKPLQAIIYGYGLEVQNQYYHAHERDMAAARFLSNNSFISCFV